MHSLHRIPIYTFSMDRKAETHFQMYASKWKLGLYLILNTIKWQMTVVILISQKCYACGRILSYTLVMSPFCHDTFIVLHCSPHDWASYLFKVDLAHVADNVQARKCVKQEWSKSEADPELKEEYQSF